MRTHHRGEHSELGPAHYKLAKLRVFISLFAVHLIMSAEKSSEVGVAVGVACHGKIEMSGYLLSEHIPCRAYIACPHVASVTLLAKPSRAGEYKHTLRRVLLYLVVMHTADREQRIGSSDTSERTFAGGKIHIAVKMIGLRRVHPPAVHPEGVETLQIVPVYVAGLVAVSVVDLHARGVIHARRPLGVNARLRPRGDVKEQSAVGKLAVRLGLRTK